LYFHTAHGGAKRIAGRAVVVLNLSGRERRHAERAGAHLHEANVETVFSERAFFNADPHRPDGFVLTGVGDKNGGRALSGRRRKRHRNDRRKAQQQRKNIFEDGTFGSMPA
jgi:hypothetical protein